MSDTFASEGKSRTVSPWSMKLVMKDITTKSVELSHLQNQEKSLRTPSHILAAVAQTKVMRASSQSCPQEEQGVESVGEDSIFGESPVGEDSVFRESQGPDSTFGDSQAS